MIAFWDAAAGRSTPFPDDPAGIPAWIGEDGPAPARCALDLALHDRIGRQRSAPLYEVLGLSRPPVLPTSYTISIGEPAEMADWPGMPPPTRSSRSSWARTTMKAGSQPCARLVPMPA